MASIFITGSSDGLGLLAAKALIQQGHKVVLHARNNARAQETLKKLAYAEKILVADLKDIEETKHLAQEANQWGAFDTVIHNAGVYQASSAEIFAVNTLAPYILTCLIRKPKRLIYLSSGMHMHGHFNPGMFNDRRVTYSDSKLHVLILCKAVSRKWPDVNANTVNPGWVPTKMGGRGAPDDLQKGYETQVWLATSQDPEAKVSGRYFFHQKERRHDPEADDVGLQERFLKRCEEITGISFPNA